MARLAGHGQEFDGSEDAEPIQGALVSILVSHTKFSMYRQPRFGIKVCIF
jgi:hypothetical protein